MWLRGTSTLPRGIEKIVLYEKYVMERMAEVNAVAAQVIAHSDQKKAGEFMAKYMDYIFPEVADNKEQTIAQKMAELKLFSEKTFKLDVSDAGLKLFVEEKA
jgi:uncharacterized protein (DUF1810 family)